MKTNSPAHDEIIALHDAVESWICGRAAEGSFESDIAARFHSDFSLVAPGGMQLGRADLLRGMRGSFGENPDFALKIRSPQVLAQGTELVVASCTLWQRNARQSSREQNGRVITAVFRRDPARPHGLVWLRAQETWLPEAEQDAGEYDW